MMASIIMIFWSKLELYSEYDDTVCENRIQ
jgi:hypothetical protein